MDVSYREVPDKRKLLYVEWVDSARSDQGWEFVDDIGKLEPAHCVTVGFLLQETATYKTLVQTMSRDQILNRITIPTRAILKIRVLRQPRRPGR